MKRAAGRPKDLIELESWEHSGKSATARARRWAALHQRRSRSPNRAGGGSPRRIVRHRMACRGRGSAGGGSANGGGLDDALREDADLGDRDQRHRHRALADPGQHAAGRRPGAGRRAGAGRSPPQPAGRPRPARAPRARGRRSSGSAAAGRRGRRRQDPRDVIDRHRAHGSIAQPDQAEDREGAEGLAQVVEHVVAAAIDHARLEDRVTGSRRRGRAPRRPTWSGGRRSDRRVARGGSSAR